MTSKISLPDLLSAIDAVSEESKYGLKYFFLSDIDAALKNKGVVADRKSIIGVIADNLMSEWIDKTPEGEEDNLWVKNNG
ncbi:MULTISPECIES: hypothetical protein [Enterobacteriaceae]|uniref:Uncharacterized protein n=2 Tax=Klebsiella pneumoniae TaxID=573 RepID=A0A483LAS0_KLEPN|nr:MULTISPECIES: hypothetical protein [Enterobacteriaceae]HDU5201152.1 hypothetical protein [Klebsiella pneumoniae subsp. pneumoniae]MCD9733906.1 hypothetical protein [Klebsiella pneumoniae]MDS0501673.1 hypothetical protein [Klebsiella pneumoniae]MDY7170619.1 hypothetical protein [Klebsiella pneumoniae]UKL48368.1 hypothetical protein L7G50_07960 [Klebsiella pneumoniae]